MVPVPEDLVEPVLAFIAWKGPPRAERRSEATGEPPGEPPGALDTAVVGSAGPIARAFEAVDQSTRRLLAAIAVASLEPVALEVVELAGAGVPE